MENTNNNFNTVKTYIKEYDLKQLLTELDIEEINQKVIDRINYINQDNFKYKENLNNTNSQLWWESAKFWFITEEILSILDINLIQNKKEMGQKYDFKTNRLNKVVYIDIKSFKIKEWKKIEEISQKKYKWYFQAEQIFDTYKYCIKENIEFKDLFFEVVWWDWNYEWKLYRCFNINMNLEYILTNYTPRFENPFNTSWNDKAILNYVIDLFQKNNENNIILK